MPTITIKCNKCEYSRRFEQSDQSRKFRCPKCPSGILKLPKVGSKKVSERGPVARKAAKKPKRLLECSACKTLISKGQALMNKGLCPICKVEREFTESDIESAESEEILREANLKNPKNSRKRPTPETSRAGNSQGIIGFLVGVVVGAILVFAIVPKGATTQPQQAKNTTPKVIADPVSTDKPDSTNKPDNSDSTVVTHRYMKTPTGRYRHALEGDFTMEGKVFQILEVVDGDTMHLDELPNDAKVRLLGVDTPETKHATKGIQFWGKQASAFTKKLLSHKKVIVHIDPKQPYGVFGRPLVYLELTDGRDFNAMLVQQGFARVTTEYPFSRMEEYLKYEKKAKSEQLGMWNKSERAAWDAAKKKKEEAEKAAERAAAKAEMDSRLALIKAAEKLGGKYVKGRSSKTLHKAWCPRRPRKDPVYFSDLEKKLKEGCKKHSCFKSEP